LTFLSGLEINNTSTGSDINDNKVHHHRSNDDVKVRWKTLLYDDDDNNDNNNDNNDNDNNNDDENDTNSSAEIIPSLTSSLSTDILDYDKANDTNKVPFAW